MRVEEAGRGCDDDTSWCEPLSRETAVFSAEKCERDRLRCQEIFFESH